MNIGGTERGVSLVEVLVSVFILVAGALAAANLHTTALSSAHISASHFALNQLGNEAVETLRLYKDTITESGYQFSSESGEDDSGGDETELTELDQTLLEWNSRIASSISTGQGSILCGSDFCDVTISWKEEIDGTLRTQVYAIGTPL